LELDADAESSGHGLGLRGSDADRRATDGRCDNGWFDGGTYGSLEDRGTDSELTVGRGLRRLELDRGTDGGSSVRLRLGRLEWDRGADGGASNGMDSDGRSRTFTVGRWAGGRRAVVRTGRKRLGWILSWGRNWGTR
jgi:hypothetical protein